MLNDKETKFYIFDPSSLTSNHIKSDGPLCIYLNDIGEYDGLLEDIPFYENIVDAIDQKDNMNIMEGEFPKEYFYYACKVDNPELISWMIDNFEDLNLDIGLEVCCSYGNVENAREILRRNVNLHNNRTIILASLSNNYEILKLLIDAGFNFRIFNDLAFVLACENGNLKSVKLLVEKDCNIFTTGENEEDAFEEDMNEGFRLACKKSRYDVISYLIEIGVDINSGFPQVLATGNFELAKIFIESGVDTSNTLRYACISNNLELIKYMFNISNKPTDKFNLLDYANDEEIVYFLFVNGFKPTLDNIKIKFYQRNYSVAKILLRNYSSDTYVTDIETLIKELIVDYKIIFIKFIIETIDFDCKDLYDYTIRFHQNETNIIKLFKKHSK